MLGPRVPFWRSAKLSDLGWEAPSFSPANCRIYRTGFAAWLNSAHVLMTQPCTERANMLLLRKS
jgi:hypothetical protein